MRFSRRLERDARCLRLTNRNTSPVFATRRTLLCHRYLATHPCVYWWMHAQRGGCVRPGVVHMRVKGRWPWEQCVMTPAERWCVKRCNVCARRRCQHHGPLSWPGFLTQRFLSELIGPDTNFLAELQCGRSNLIAATPLHPPPGSSFDYPTARQSHLNSRRPPVDVFFQHHFWLGGTHTHTHTHSLSHTVPGFLQKLIKRCCPVCSKHKDFCKSCSWGNPARAVKF